MANYFPPLFGFFPRDHSDDTAVSAFTTTGTLRRGLGGCLGAGGQPRHMLRHFDSCVAYLRSRKGGDIRIDVSRFSHRQGCGLMTWMVFRVRQSPPATLLRLNSLVGVSVARLVSWPYPTVEAFRADDTSI